MPRIIYRVPALAFGVYVFPSSPGLGVTRNEDGQGYSVVKS